ncbi:hypothetical protein AB0F81_32325 [Actinoplanes sp. NPDC024001]|uniref:hypothetical protein n=1 Tax=Actinoplanes sp. NPDC024001 TaxID=3154598 RepID=UPI0033F17D82
MDEEEPGPEPVQPADETAPADEPNDGTEPEAKDDEDLTRFSPQKARSRIDEMFGRADAIRTRDIRSHGQMAVGDNATVADTIYNWNFGQKRTSWWAVVPQEHIDRLVGTYAPGPSDPELTESLASRSVVYLSAPYGGGRYTAAYVALAARHSPGRVVMIHVTRGARIAEAVDETCYSEDHGHVIDATAAESIEFMDLLSVAAIARDRRATVVVIGELADHGHDLGAFLVRHRRPAPGEVFRAHLRHRLESRGRCVAACEPPCRLRCVPAYVTRLAGDPLVERHFNEAMRLESAATIAAAVAESKPGEEAGVLAECLDRHLRDQARVMLRADDDERLPAGRRWSGSAEYRRLFRLAFVALEDVPMAAVYRAADRLAHPQPAGGDELEVPFEPVEFELEGLLSSGIRETGREAAGLGTPTTACLANPELVPAMLDIAWNERGLGARLMRWLDVLAVDPQAKVRERAGMIAGLLCRNDFDGVMTELVDPWARDARPERRQAAGLCLMTCAHVPVLRRAVEERVQRWMDPGPRQRYTHTHDSVAWAYAYGLGALLPYGTFGLRHLRRVGLDGWQRRSLLIAVGVEQTFRRDRAAALLGDLDDWVRSPEGERRLRAHACRAFVRLAQRECDRDDGRWPEMLRWHQCGDLDGDRLPGLWTAALSLPPTAAPAWRQLGRWIELGEQSPELAGRIVGLVRRLCRDLHLRDRLRHQHDHIWRERRASPLLAAVGAVIEGG